MKVQGWLREEALEWASKIDADLAAKEKDTQTVKQERQHDLMALKVCLLHSHAHNAIITTVPTCTTAITTVRTPFIRPHHVLPLHTHPLP